MPVSGAKREITMKFKNTIVASLVLPLCACTPNIYSPPARFALLETPETVPTGDHALAAIGGLEAAVDSAKAVFGTITYRTGATETIEVGLDANVAWVGDPDCDLTKATPEDCKSNADPPVDNVVYSGRVQAKWAFAKQKVALVGGLGGGHNFDAGSFISPDVGVVVAYPVGGLTPFAGATVFFSQPFNTEPVDVSFGEDPPQSRWDEASQTWGWYLHAGVSYTLSPPRKEPRTGIEGRVKIGVNLFGLEELEKSSDNVRHRAQGLGIQVGPELIF